MTSCVSIRSKIRALNKHQWQIFHIALIVLAGTAIYSNTLNVPFVLDDHFSISFHGQKNLLENLLHGGARRVADFTFALNYRMHGLQVTGYHLVNLAIHLSTSVIIYFVIVSSVTALSATFAPQDATVEEISFVERFIPFAVALLFVSHPVQTQAVTYIIQRYTSLATLLYMASTLFFLKSRLSFEKNCTYGYTLFLGSASLISGLLALGSKQIAATLPVMLLFLEIFLFRGRLINRRFYIACGALFVFVLLIGFIKWHDSSLHDFVYDLNYATSEDHNTSRTTYFFTQTRVVISYLSLLCLPLGQSLMPDSPIYTSLFSVPVIASLAMHTALISTAVVVFKKSRKNLLSHDWTLGVLQRLSALGIVWFYLAMTVESSIIPIRDVIFEHRIYLPSTGFFITITAVIALATHGRRAVAWTLVTAICLVLGGLTIARNQVWNNTLTLWQDTVKQSPHQALALANLGGAYLDRNMPDKALPLFVRAIELNANFQAFHLGEVLQRLNVDRSRFTTGKEFFSPGGPLGSGIIDRGNMAGYAAATTNTLALAYEYLGNLEMAKTCFSNALAINPAYDLAWYNIGLLSVRLGDMQPAVNALIQLKKLNPSLANSLESGIPH